MDELRTSAENQIDSHPSSGSAPGRGAGHADIPKVTGPSWKEIAELVGIASLVASLVFVGLQLKQAQDIAMSENDMALLQSQVDVRNALNAHALVWVKGASGESLSATDSIIFTNLVTMLNNEAFFDYLRATRLGQDDIAEVTLHDFAAYLHQHPGARRVWLAREESLIRYRSQLAKGGGTFSFWKDAILADLSALDAQ